MVAKTFQPKSTMDYGLAGLCTAGVEASNQVLGHGLIGLDVTLPSTVQTQIAQLDAAIQGFNAEALTVADVGFLRGWNAFTNEWNEFKKANANQFAILKNNPSTVLAEVQQHKETLNGWLAKYQALTGKSSSTAPQKVPQPPAPKPPPDEGLHPSTKILLGLLAALALAGAGYATYRYVQTARKQTRAGKKFLSEELALHSTPAARATRLALEGA